MRIRVLLLVLLILLAINLLAISFLSTLPDSSTDLPVDLSIRYPNVVTHDKTAPSSSQPPLPVNRDAGEVEMKVDEVDEVEEMEEMDEVAVCAVVRDESDSIREWILFHLETANITRFYLYDHVRHAIIPTPLLSCLSLSLGDTEAVPLC